MGKFKINVIAHQLKGKKIASFGEVVDESELTSDSSILVNKGYIVPIGDTPEEIEAKKLAKETAKKGLEGAEAGKIAKEAVIQKENEGKAFELEVVDVVDSVIIDTKNTAATNAASKLKGKVAPKK